MKAIIVYYSMSGNVRRTAERIAAETDADLLELYPEKSYPDTGAKKFIWGGKSAIMGDKPRLKPYVFSADKYDTVIFASPVWASSFTPPIRTFIEDNRGALKGKRFASVLCLMGSGDKKAVKKLKKFLNAEELAAELVLIEPKSKPEGETENSIAEFCRALKANDDQG